MFGPGSFGVRAGGESIGALAAVGGRDEVVTAILSVEVVGGPMIGLAGDLRGL